MSTTLVTAHLLPSRCQTQIDDEMDEQDRHDQADDVQPPDSVTEEEHTAGNQPDRAADADQAGGQHHGVEPLGMRQGENAPHHRRIRREQRFDHRR